MNEEMETMVSVAKQARERQERFWTRAVFAVRTKGLDCSAW